MDDHTQSFKDAFKKFLKEENLDKKYQQKKLVSEWKSLMGTTIGNRTRKVFFKRNILFVELDSGPLKHELMVNREKILKMLEEKYGAGLIDEVRFL
jgi:predicted nucleic acid-binding Zn ribbon protein